MFKRVRWSPEEWRNFFRISATDSRWSGEGSVKSFDVEDRKDTIRITSAVHEYACEANTAHAHGGSSGKFAILFPRGVTFPLSSNACKPYRIRRKPCTNSQVSLEKTFIISKTKADHSLR